MASVESLRALVAKARRILVFTGAGISTSSNIPDFRGPNGVYKRRSPVYFQDFVASSEARREYWEFKLEGYLQFRDAKPNAAHHAIVDLEKAGRVGLVVTQNVDGLHQLAGTSRDRLVELHGTNAENECIDCSRREPPERCMTEFEKTREPPRCPKCDGLMKPAVVMFGQALRSADLEQAREASQLSDLVLALGSSLTVTPAADIPLFGVRRGAPYVIVNQGETPHDELATLRFDANVSELLPKAVADLAAPG
jgi:NAD-dependent protein deacetylase/lipoamidase